MKTLRAPAIALFPLLLLAACAGTGPRPGEVEIPGYGTLRDPLRGRDVSALAGRRIVLDPGHGGFFTGAVGPSGLTEAEVNLGVALHLRGLLEWAGAEVWMTRTADTDFLSPADSSLVGDLAFRVAFTDSLQPDAFLSLHHNSVASLDRTVNETQTYYPLGDAGASLDLARAIHRHLVLNLEIRPARILPGNFHVLRHATVPAVLGEPAMISHPVIEGRLSLAASQRLEAEAYFVGLLDYFAQGNPVWHGAARDTLPVPGPGEAAAMAWTFLPDGEGRDAEAGPGLDPTTVRVTLDGVDQRFDLAPDGRTVRWHATDGGPAAPAWLAVSARNLAGRRTPERRTLVPARRAAVLRLTAFGDDRHPDPVALAWRTASGRPAPAGRVVFGPDLAVATGGGTGGWAAVPDGAWPAGEPAPDFVPDDPDAPAPTLVLDTRALSGPWRWAILGGPDGSVAALPAPPVVRSGSGPAGARPDPGHPRAPLVAWHTGERLWLEVPGYRPVLRGPAGDDPGAPAPDGPLQLLMPDLAGRVVVLDPAGGGGDPDGAGPLGMRGADLNLDVARILADLLRGAGARPVLTRRDGTVPAPEEKVALAGRHGADFFLTIGRARPGEGPTAAHHHGSPVGTRWAARTAAAAGPLLAAEDTVAVRPSWDYLLRHTACPALEVRLPGPDDESAELILADPARQRAEAIVLLQAIVAAAAATDSLPPVFRAEDFLARGGLGIDPAAVRLVVLDGQFPWTPRSIRAAGGSGTAPDPLSSWREPGFPLAVDEHTIEIRHRDGWALYRYDTGDPARSVELLLTGP